ncbi:unnamed protein product [Lymnaea stagnalis]|uniref:Rad60/SUMO-like domain-containing protein n=1 Tax=Lymnaea stagnalis TaxID=6523 RepID=A0AAV2IH67_LYMST
MKKSRASKVMISDWQDSSEEIPASLSGNKRESPRLLNKKKSGRTVKEKPHLGKSSNLTVADEHQLNVIDFNCSTDASIDNQPPSNSDLLEPKKTARRGLTKKNSYVELTQPTQVHNVSVYSQCVPETFKHLMENVSILNKSKFVSEANHEDNNPKKSNINAETNQSIQMNDDTEGSTSHIETEPSEVESDDPKPGDSSLVIRSPTPPRQVRVTKKKNRKVNKKINGALKTLNSLKDKLNHTTPAKRKRRSKDDDIIFIHEEKPEISVKVRYLSTVHRIKMRTTEPLHSLISKLSPTIGEDENVLALYLRDECLKLSETPLSLSLSVADIIECHCLKTEEGDSSEAIQLVIQCHSNKTKTVITASKRGLLRDVMNKYAAMKNLDPSTLVFSFDGEDIDPTDTPLKLEMEDHDCIDVTDWLAT